MPGHEIDNTPQKADKTESGIDPSQFWAGKTVADRTAPGGDRTAAAGDRTAPAGTGEHDKIRTWCAAEISGIHNQLASADNAMRQVNVAVEKQGLPANSEQYKSGLNTAVTAYSQAIQHALKDVSRPEVVQAIKQELQTVQQEKAFLTAKAESGQPLSAQEMQALGTNSNDFRKLLRDRTQDEMSMTDLLRSVGYTEANFGLAMLRSAADLPTGEKEQRIKLGEDHLAMAQQADPNTDSDPNFQKHRAAIYQTLGVNEGALTPSVADGLTPATDRRPDLQPTTDVGQLGQVVSNQPYLENGAKNPKFNDPYQLMKMADANLGLQGYKLAVQAADGIDQRALQARMQAEKAYLTQALSGPNGPTLKDISAKEMTAGQHLQGDLQTVTGLTQQLVYGGGNQNQVSFIGAMTQMQSSQQLEAYKQQYAAQKTQLESTPNGRDILTAVDDFVKTKEGGIALDAQLSKLDPTFKAARDGLMHDEAYSSSPIQTRAHYMDALLKDVAANGDNATKDKSLQALRTAGEIYRLDPTVLDGADPNSGKYKGFVQRLNMLGVTPEQFKQAIGDSSAARPVPTSGSDAQLPTERSAVSDRSVAQAAGTPEQPPYVQARALYDAASKAYNQIDQDTTLTAEQKQLKNDELYRQIDPRFKAILSDATPSTPQAVEAQRQSIESQRQALSAMSGKLAEQISGKLNVAGKSFEEITQQLTATEAGTAAKIPPAQLAATNAAFGQYMKLRGANDAASQAQLETVKSQLQQMAGSDPTMGQYISTLNKLDALSQSADVKAYVDAKKNFIATQNQTAMVEGLYGMFLIQSFHDKESVPHIAKAAQNPDVMQLMPGITQAANYLKTQNLASSSVSTTGEPGQLMEKASEVGTAAPASANAHADFLAPIQLDAKSQVGADATAAQPTPEQLAAAQNQMRYQLVPGSQNLDNAIAIMADTSLTAEQRLAKASSEFETAIKLSGQIDTGADRKTFSTVEQEAEPLQQYVQAASTDQAASNLASQDPVGTQQKVDRLSDLAGQGQVLSARVQQPVLARYTYAQAMNLTAAQLYQQASSDPTHKDDLTQRADALNAKAVGMLQQIGQVDSNYGAIGTDASGVERMKTQIDGATMLAQKHAVIDDNKALALGYAAAADKVVKDGLAPGLGQSAAGKVLQPLYSAAITLESIPGVSTVANLVSPANLSALSPETTAQKASALQAKAKLADLTTADAALSKSEQSSWSSMVHTGADMISGMGGWIVADALAGNAVKLEAGVAAQALDKAATVSLAAKALGRLAPVNPIVKGAIALGTDALSTYLINKAAGTDDMTAGEFATHVGGSWASMLGVRGIMGYKAELSKTAFEKLGNNPETFASAFSPSLKGKLAGTTDLGAAYKTARQAANSAVDEFKTMQVNQFSWYNLGKYRNQVNPHASYLNTIKDSAARTKIEQDLTAKGFDLSGKIGTSQYVSDAIGDVPVGSRVLSRLNPVNIWKGAVKQEVLPLDAAGKMKGSLSDVGARLFYSKMAFPAAAAFVGTGTYGASQAAPWLNKADGSRYTVGDTASAFVTDGLIGTGATLTGLGAVPIAGKLGYKVLGWTPLLGDGLQSGVETTMSKLTAMAEPKLSLAEVASGQTKGFGHSLTAPFARIYAAPMLSPLLAATNQGFLSTLFYPRVAAESDRLYNKQRTDQFQALEDEAAAQEQQRRQASTTADVSPPNK